MDDIKKIMHEMTQQIDNRLADFETTFDEGTGVHTILVIPHRKDFCGIEISVEGKYFDVTLDDLISESDIRHDDIDFRSVFFNAAAGRITIIERFFMGIKFFSSATINDEGDSLVFSTQWCDFPVPNFLANTKTHSYGSFLRS